MFDKNHPFKVATITFTKHFIAGSILEGLTYDETIEFGSQESADHFMGFLKKHTTKPVKACAGSHYTVSNIELINA